MILPLVMSNTGDMRKNWFMWKQCFLEYMEWNNYNERPEEYKINVLRRLLGYDALRDPLVNHILNYTTHMHKSSTLTQVLRRLDDFFGNMKNELVERYNFFSRFQEEDEPIETYINDLIEKAETCNFGSRRDSIIRDKVIASIKSKEHRLELLQTLNLNLPKLLQICKAHEARSNYNNPVKKRERQIAFNSPKILLMEQSNSNNKKVAEEEQNSNDKVNAKINVKAKENPKNDNSGKNIIGTTNQTHSDTSNKAKTDSEMHNSGSNIMSTACRENNANIGNKTKTNPKIDAGSSGIIGITNRRHSDNSNTAKTGMKMDNNGSNILSTACKENNANIGNKTKTNPKNGKSSSGIIGTTNQRHSDNSNTAKTGMKMDNNGSNILSTACKEKNANIGNKTKTNPKNDKSSSDIIGTTNQRHSDNNNKAKTNTKMDNNGSNIVSTACKENNANIGDKTKTVAKNGNNQMVSNLIDLVSQENIDGINDKAKIDSEGMNSNPNMNTACQNSVSSGTEYRRNCWKCKEKHPERSCPAWGHKCENCGERNHFRNCCKMKPLKTTEHINMSSIENALNTNHFQHNNQLQPTPPYNYSLVADIEPCYLPSAPKFCESENELCPKLCQVSTFQACAPLNPEAAVGNTEPKTAATETQNHKKRSNSDVCLIS